MRAPDGNDERVKRAAITALNAVERETGDPANLDPAFVDVIKPGDLEGLGLSGYLEQGVGAARDTLRPDRARLDAIETPVVIVLSSAFRGKRVRMRPDPPLRWVGTWSETRSAPPKPPRQFHGVTDGEVSGSTPSAPGRGSSRLLQGIVIAVALVILVAVLILLGGRS